MQAQNQATLTELANLFNYMFDKQQLRKNTYLFNAVSQHMILSVRTIQKEKRVTAITNNLSLILSALKNCPLVQVLSDTSIRLLMKGDQTVVRLKSSQGKHITKKEVNNLTRQMRCESKQEKNEWVLQFQSHAAAVQFIERAKTQQRGYLFQLLQNDPYECLAKSISNLRKQKKTQKAPQEAFSYNYYQEYYYNYMPQYAPFIRKAVDSDEDQTINQNNLNNRQQLKRQEKMEQNRQNFPSFEEMIQIVKEQK